MSLDAWSLLMALAAILLPLLLAGVLLARPTRKPRVEHVDRHTASSVRSETTSDPNP